MLPIEVSQYFIYNGYGLIIHRYAASEYKVLLRDDKRWHDDVWIDITNRVSLASIPLDPSPPYVPKVVSDALAIYIKSGGIAGLTINEYLEATGIE